MFCRSLLVTSVVIMVMINFIFNMVDATNKNIGRNNHCHKKRSMAIHKNNIIKNESSFWHKPSLLSSAQSFQMPIHENPSTDVYRSNQNQNRNQQKNMIITTTTTHQGWKPSNLKNLLIDKQHNQQPTINKNEGMIPIIKANHLFTTPILQRSNKIVNHSTSTNAHFTNNHHHHPHRAMSGRSSTSLASLRKSPSIENLNFVENNRHLWNSLTSSSISNDLLDNELNQIQTEIIKKYKPPLDSMNSLGKQIALFLLNRNRESNPTATTTSMAKHAIQPITKAMKSTNIQTLNSQSYQDQSMPNAYISMDTLPMSSPRYEAIIVDHKTQQHSNGPNNPISDTRTISPSYLTTIGQTQMPIKNLFVTVPFGIDSSTAINAEWPSLVQHNGQGDDADDDGGSDGRKTYVSSTSIINQDSFHPQQQHPNQRPRTSTMIKSSSSSSSLMNNEPTDFVFMAANLATTNKDRLIEAPSTLKASSSMTGSITTNFHQHHPQANANNNNNNDIGTSAFIPIQSSNSISFEPLLITNNQLVGSVSNIQNYNDQQQQQYYQQPQQANEQFHWSPEVKNVVLKMELPVHVTGSSNRPSPSTISQNYHYQPTYRASNDDDDDGGDGNNGNNNNNNNNDDYLNSMQPSPSPKSSYLQDDIHNSDSGNSYQLSLPYPMQQQSIPSTTKYRSNHNHHPHFKQQQSKMMNIYSDNNNQMPTTINMDHLDQLIDAPHHYYF